MKYFRNLFFVLFLFYHGISSSFACTMQSWDLEPQYIANSNPSVGGIYTKNGQVYSFGSVINIGNGWGLTAAHVIDSGPPVKAYFGGNILEGADHTSLIDEWYLHPLAESTGNNFRFDLGVVHFSDEDALSDVPVAKMRSNKPEIGDSIQFTGLGSYGVVGQPSKKPNGNARGWNGVINSFGDGDAADHYIVSEFSRNIYLSGLGQPGDSGGGVFDEDGYLVAVVSAVSAVGYTHYGISTYACGLWTEETGGWVTEKTGIALFDSTNPNQGVPEPATMALMGVSLLFLPRRRDN